jgi:hypothetical protein
MVLPDLLVKAHQRSLATTNLPGVQEKDCIFELSWPLLSPHLTLQLVAIIFLRYGC